MLGAETAEMATASMITASAAAAPDGESTDSRPAASSEPIGMAPNAISRSTEETRPRSSSGTSASW